MIAAMSEVLILGRKRDTLEVVRALQDVGVVQLDPLEPNELPKAVLVGADAERKAQLERQLARAESALAALGASDIAPEPSKLRGADMAALLETIGAQADVLSKERNELASELSAIGSFGSLARTLAELSGSLGKGGRTAILGFNFADEDKPRLEQNLKDASLTYSLGHQPIAKGNAGVLAVRVQDAGAARTALSRSGLAETRFPGAFDGMSYTDASSRMEQRSRTAPEDLQSNNAQIERLRVESGGALAAARIELRDELSRLDAVGNSVAGKYGFALRGWVPDANKSQLESALAPLKGQVVYSFAAAPEHHAGHVPVKLENNAVFKPFEMLIGLFAPPAYGSFDPTWVLAIFFPLFFGFIIGDIGLGLVSLSVALWMRSKANAGKSLEIDLMSITVPPDALGKVASILMWMAGWSIVWGFVYGEFFGTLGEHLGIFKFYADEPGLILSPLHRVDPGLALTMMNLALIPGIVQILYGWFLRFRLGMKHHDRKHMFEGLGMMLGLVGLILVAYAYRNPGSPSWIYIVAAICGLIFLACVVISGVYLMLMEILSNGGNILSYLRLFAVGLSSAILANLATDLGWSLGQSLGAGGNVLLGILGVVVGIVVASAVHLIAIVFTIIGHVLQPLRLHYAEFFTKFGFYDESGRRYSPFARVSQRG